MSISTEVLGKIEVELQASLKDVESLQEGVAEMGRIVDEQRATIAGLLELLEGADA